MPISSSHAFAKGPSVSGRPTGGRRLVRRALSWLARALEEQEAWNALESFQAGAQVEGNFQAGPHAWCFNPGGPGRVVLGGNVVCRGVVRVEPYGAGTVRVGADCYLGDDTLLSCAAGITLESGVLLAHGAQIFDNDSHPVDAAARAADFKAVLQGGPRVGIATAPVHIGRGAWVGMNALVFKGVTIGQGAVVAGGAVVVHDVPPFTLVGGNPARPLKALSQP